MVTGLVNSLTPRTLPGEGRVMLTSGSDYGRTFDNMIIPQRHISGLVTADQFPAQAAI